MSVPTSMMIVKGLVFGRTVDETVKISWLVWH